MKFHRNTPLILVFILILSCSNNDITDPIVQASININNQTATTLFYKTQNSQQTIQLNPLSTTTIEKNTHMGNTVAPITEYLLTLQLFSTEDAGILIYEQSPINSELWLLDRNEYTLTITDQDLQ